jgi:hypothetical protein
VENEMPVRNPASTRQLTPAPLKIATAAAASAAGRAACEWLEGRALFAVSLGADGFTDVTPSADTRTVYVSSSSGSDANNGLTPGAAVRSISRGIALVRDNAPDHLLLKRGDAWTETVNWTKSGRSASQPMVLGSYGDAQAARPAIRSGGNTAIEARGSVDHVAFLGLHLWADKREAGVTGFTSADAYGIRFLAGTKGLLIEDCVIDQYADNVSIQAYDGAQSNVSIRRSVITDAWSTRGKAQGLYAYDVDGLLLEENVFDHNGWYDKVAGAGATIYSHNAYIAATCGDVVVRGNVFADAASHGLQARSGGEITGNLFLRNPIHLSFGLVNGSDIKAGGVTGTVSGNVMLETRAIGGDKRGWAIEVGNVKSATIRDNIISNDGGQGGLAAINLAVGSNVSNAGDGVGINKLLVEDNVVYKWQQSMTLSGELSAGGGGHASLNDLTVRDNDFQMVYASSHEIVSHAMAVNRAEESWSNNRYYEDAAQSEWFGISTRHSSFATWRGTVEPTAVAQQVAYANPERNIASYQQSVSGTASLSGFLSAARGRAGGGWTNNAAARNAVSYIRAGFDKSAVATPTPTPTTPTEPEPTSQPDPTPVPSDTVAPTVIAYAGGVSSVTVQFSESVRASLSAGDLQLRLGNQQVRGNALRLSYNAATNTGTWTWPGYSNGTLPDGEWSVRIAGTAVSDAAGNRLAGGAGLAFSFTVATTPPAPTPTPTPEPEPEPEPEPTPTPNPQPTNGDRTRPKVLSYRATATSITIKFSEDVSASLSASDLSLRGERSDGGRGGRERHRPGGSGGFAGVQGLRVTYDAATNEATWTWDGQLARGRWEAGIDNDDVRDAAGNGLEGRRDFGFAFNV